MSGANVEAANTEQVKTLMPRVSLIKTLTIISVLLIILIAAALIAGNIHNWTVVFGVHFLDQLSNKIQKRKIAKIIKHPQATSCFHDDVTLLELSQPVEFTDFVQPACLPAASAFIFDRRCAAIRWGKRSENGTDQKILYMCYHAVASSSGLTKIGFPVIYVPTNIDLGKSSHDLGLKQRASYPWKEYWFFLAENIL